jgi:hypothetical protein
VSIDQYVLVNDHESCPIRPVEPLHQALPHLVPHKHLASQWFSTEGCLFGNDQGIFTVIDCQIILSLTFDSLIETCGIFLEKEHVRIDCLQLIN